MRLIRLEKMWNVCYDGAESKMTDMIPVSGDRRTCHITVIKEDVMFSL